MKKRPVSKAPRSKVAPVVRQLPARTKAGKFDEITAKYPQLVGKMTLPKAN